MVLDRDDGSDHPTEDGRPASELAATSHGEGKMTRRLLLFLAGSWPWPAGAFAQASPKSDSNASSDFAVLEVVLRDLLSWPESPLEFHSTTEKQLLFSPEALADPLEVPDILHRLDRRKRTKLSRAQLRLAREAASDLV